MSRIVRPLVVGSGLVACARWLWSAGGGAGPVDPARWVEPASPAHLALEVIRLTGLGLATYLLVVVALHAVATLGHYRRAGAVLGRLSTAAVRRVVAVLLGTALTAVAVAGASRPAGAPPRPPTALLVRDAEPVAPGAGGTAIIQPLPPTSAPPEPARPAPPSPPPPTWRVAPGDHFWSIAERVLTAAWARPPTDAEVAPYWQAVIAANHARLVDPHNPDLLHAGLVLDLPAPPGPPGHRSGLPATG